MQIWRRHFSTKLRPYQAECVQVCLDKLAAGVKRQIVSLPTGSGKSVIMAHLVGRVPEPNPSATKTLILAHREELLMQIYRHLRQLPTVDGIAAPIIDIDQAHRRANVADAQIIISSVQSLAHSSKLRIGKYDPSMFKCIITDEAHHATASTYMKIFDHFKVLQKDSPIFLWGCSATVARHDMIALDKVFEEITYHRPISAMIDAGYLCPAKVVQVKTNVKLDGVQLAGGDYQSQELSKTVNTPERNKLALEIYQRLHTKHKFKATLVFAVDIKHCEDLEQFFSSQGVQSEAITSKTSRTQRLRILSDYRLGKIPVLINCGILTEGTDIPIVDCLLMTRPTRSQVLYQQMLGRGLRLSKDKQVCYVVDFVDVYNNVSGHVIPTLHGIDVSSLSLEKSPSIKTKAAKALDPHVAEFELLLKSIKEKDFDFGKQVKMSVYGSKLAWVNLQDNRFGIPALGGNIFLLEPGSKANEYSLTLRRKMKVNNRHFYQSSENVFQAVDIASALKSAETFIAKTVSFTSMKLMHRSAAWRKLPATEAQIAWLGGRIAKYRHDKDALANANRGDIDKIVMYMQHRKRK